MENSNQTLPINMTDEQILKEIKALNHVPMRFALGFSLSCVVFTYIKKRTISIKSIKETLIENKKFSFLLGYIGGLLFKSLLTSSQERVLKKRFMDNLYAPRFKNGELVHKNVKN